MNGWMRGWRSLALMMVVGLAQAGVAPLPRPPLVFEPAPNGDGTFVARGPGYQLALDAGGARLALRAGERVPRLLRWRLLDANAHAARGETPLASQSHYVALDDRAPPRSAPHFARVRVAQAWPGIDVVYYGTADGQLEYDFVLAPGADPSRIAFAVDGAQSLALAPDGALQLHTPEGVLTQHAPIVYQTIDRERRAIDGRFVLAGNEVRFALAEYDRANALVIDPVLAWSSYLGGSGDDQVFDIDEQGGFVYAAGRTLSANFPVANALDGVPGGDADCFVSKFSANGGALLWSTYLGAAGNDFCNGIAVDADGEAYVAGIQASGAGDAFLAKLNAAGSALAYPVVTRAGSGLDQAVSVAVTPAGVATVVGYTDSSNFPTTAGVAQLNDGPGRGAFAFRVAANGALAWSTYLDGNGDQSALSVAIDNAGNSYVGGRSTDLDANGDGYVVKLTPSAGIAWNTARVNGNAADAIHDVQVDAISGEVFFTGYSDSNNLPTTAGVLQRTWSGDREAIVGKFNANGVGFAWLTYLGGLRPQVGNALRRDAAGNVYIAGRNDLGDASGDAFLIKIGPQASHVHYNLQFGGNGSDAANGLAVAANGSAWLGGVTASDNFVVTDNAQDESANGALDGFVMKIAPAQEPPDVQTIVTPVQIAGTAGGPNGAPTTPPVTLQPGDLVTVEPLGGRVQFHGQVPPGGGPGTNPGGPQGPGDPNQPAPRPASVSMTKTSDEGNDGDPNDPPSTPGVLCEWEVGPAGYARNKYLERQFCHPNDVVTNADPIVAPNAGHAGLFRPQQPGIGGGAQFIGNDSRSFSYNGPANGSLRLGVNDATPANNGGHFNARVTVQRRVGGGGTVPVSFLAIDSPSKLEGNAGTSALAFTVTLTPASTQTVRVRVRTSDRDALAGSDYATFGEDLVFTPGQTSKIVNVTINGDAVVEADERFGVELVNPVNASTIRPRGLGTILSDDRPVVSVSGTTCNEGDSGSANCNAQVALSAATSQAVTVRFATYSDSAGAPNDFETIAERELTFSPGGALVQTVPVGIRGDFFIEGPERFRTVIYDATNATIGTASALMQIADNDSAGTVSVATGVTPHAEGAGVVQLVITRSGGLGAGPDVNYAIQPGSATALDDYRAASGLSGTVTFAGGETSKSIALTLVDDALDETDETFVFVLSNPTDGATIGNATSQRQIGDNDAPPVLAVDDDGCDALEGNGGTAPCAFTLRLSSPSAKPVSVDTRTTALTATEGADYVAHGSTTRSIPAGQTTLVVTVPVVGDTLDEPEERFALDLLAPVNATLAATQAFGDIQDDDDPAAVGTLRFAQAAYVVDEDAGTLTLTVQRIGGSAGAAGVLYASANGSAQANADYGVAAGALAFGSGQTSRTIDVPIIDEAIDEDGETFTVTLSNPTNGATLGTPATTTVTLVDDDDAPGLSIDDGGCSVNEGNTGASTPCVFTVRLSSPSSKPIAFITATADVTATAGSDYTAHAATPRSIAAGQTSTTIGVPVLGDALDEPNETFRLEFSALQNVLAPEQPGLGNIVDDDGAPSLSIGDANLIEGDTGGTPMAFTVNLQPASAQTVTVTVSTASGTALSGSDFDAGNVVLTFTPGQTSKTVNVTVRGDTEVEDDEGFVVQLSAPQNAALGDAQGTGTIRDDDLPAASALFANGFE